MHKHIAAEWTKALRSGKYTQATEHLQTQNGFCCLGVLCDLHREQSGGEWTGSPAGGMAYKPHSGNDFDNALLPVSVRDWAGLNGVSPKTCGVYLTDRNDSGWTFSELADFIDAHWEAL
jgi:hypothetical protein